MRGHRGRPVALEADEARLVGGDEAVDPGLILRHSGVDSWETGQSAASAETHHAGLDPPRVVLADQRAA